MNKLVLLTSALLTFVLAAPGNCPAQKQLKEPKEIVAKQLGGLWFEYLYTNGNRLGMDYECASMNILLKTNDTNKDASQYRMIFYGQNKTADEKFSDERNLTCGGENSTEALNCRMVTEDKGTFNYQILATD